jgi:hypothetical protein
MEEWKYSSMRSEIPYPMEISSQFHDLRLLYSSGKNPFSHTIEGRVIPQTRFEQFLEQKKYTVDNPTTNLRQLLMQLQLVIYIFYFY